ncbi:oligopeptide ABC transporter permease [Proteinivorax tanatarense]|uniref:Oligopeptide ABC transporter permease n=2 Tax=Proteinivorax tanatarense TaxID=1260629 RepID=A0AAU7VSA5_9FIRM
MNEPKGLSPWKIAKDRFFQNKLAVIGLVVLTILIFSAIFAPVLTPHDRDWQDRARINDGPDGVNWLGFDDVGRDIYTRLIYGGRVSLSVGIIATLIATTIGVTLGSIAGYFGGLADGIIMRLVDTIMCFPFFVIAVVLSATLGATVFNTILIIAAVRWTQIARVVRAEILSLKEREFVEAARALGLEKYEIIVRHLIPNVMAPIIVYSTLSIATAILLEAGLSFLGLGVSQPTPSWGNMLESAQSLIALDNRPWQWMPAGFMVFITVLSINFVGDGLRDALDPKLKQ